jgi:hypothetical protein
MANCLDEHIHHGRMNFLPLTSGNIAADTRWVYSRAVQEFRRVEISDAGEDALIKQSNLNGPATLGQ